ISTLAGGRIQTELKNTPATISILTKDFMEDLALDSNVDFASWAPNSEIPYTANGFLDEYRTSSRALSPSFGSRNYFRAYTSGDSYNTERLEYARGPNALLFGDASIGGVTTVWTKQARLDRKIASVQARFDSYGSYRTNVDYNFSPNQKIAVRANALFAHTGSWRDLEESETKAIHLAGTVALAKNTQFRIEGEYSDKWLQVPFGPILDQSSAYLNLSAAQRAAAIWNGTKTTAFPAGTTRYTTNRNVLIDSLPEVGVLNYLNRGRSTGSGLSLVPEGRAEIGGFPALPSREFNPNAPSADIIYRTATASVYLDQRIGQNLFLQVAYNYSRPGTSRDEVRMSDMYIDVNEFLPGTGNAAVNGPRNPYYGEAYSEEETRLLRTHNTLHEARALAAWKFENTWTTQAFSALVSQRQDEFKSRRFRQVPRGINTGTTYFNSNSTADLIYTRRYWNDLDGGDYGLATAFTNAAGQSLPIEWRKYEDSGNASTLTSFQLANVGKFLKGRMSVVGGYRYDKYDRIDSTLISRHGATSPDNGAPMEVIMDPAKRLVSGAHSPSVGVVYWLTSGLGLSANYAESFNLPTSGSPDIYNRPIGPSNAKGIELGLRFDLWDSKLTGSILYYENESAGGGVSTGLDAANVFNRINAMWSVVDPTQSVSTARDVQSTAGHGYEAEIVYNPTRGWRMRFAAGLPYAETTDKWIYLKDYIAENRDRWLAGGALPTNRPGTEATVRGTLEALDLYFLNNAQDGLRNTGGYKWNANYFTSYRFMTGALKGASIGGGARYNAKRFIGRTNIVNAAGVNQYTEWWADDMLLLNAMAKYDFRIAKKPASVQLNIENLLNNRDIDYRGITTVSGATYYQNYVWVPPIKFVGTATIRF
ncbi:MAG: TonB-dependent receptor, partial [Verrucomicrobiota bacterium]